MLRQWGLYSSKAICTDHAYTIFPFFCFIDANGVNVPSQLNPVSSVNALLAAWSGSSSVKAPFVIVHTPLSLFFQKGPPGCTSKNCNCAFIQRCVNMPALFSSFLFYPAQQRRCYIIFCNIYFTNSYKDIKFETCK